jgi:hypothetical protein
LIARKRRSTEALREYNTRRIKIDYYSPRPASPKDEAKGKIEDEDKIDNLVRLATKLKLKRNKKEKIIKEENQYVKVKIR